MPAATRRRKRDEGSDVRVSEDFASASSSAKIAFEAASALKASSEGVRLSEASRVTITAAIQKLSAVLVADKPAPCEEPPAKRARYSSLKRFLATEEPVVPVVVQEGWRYASAEIHGLAPGTLGCLPNPALTAALGALTAAELAVVARVAKGFVAYARPASRAACAKYTMICCSTTPSISASTGAWRDALMPLVVLEDATRAAAAWGTLEKALGEELGFEDRSFSRYVERRWPADLRRPRCSAEISVLAALISLWKSAPAAVHADSNITRRLSRLIVSVASDPSRRAPKTRRTERTFRPPLHSVVFDSGLPETLVEVGRNADAGVLSHILKLCRSVYFAYDFCSNDSPEYKERWNAMIKILLNRATNLIRDLAISDRREFGDDYDFDMEDDFDKKVYLKISSNNLIVVGTSASSLRGQPEAKRAATLRRREVLSRAFETADLELVFPDSDYPLSRLWADPCSLYAQELLSNGPVLRECLKSVCRGETPNLADMLTNLAGVSQPFALRLASTEALSLLTAATQTEDDDTPLDVSEMRKKLYNAILEATTAPCQGPDPVLEKAAGYELLDRVCRHLDDRGLDDRSPQ